MTEVDFSFFSEKSAFVYTNDVLSQLKKSENKIDASERNQRFMGIKSFEMLDILNGLLSFNPYFRNSVTECLAHPIFNDIRNDSLEQGAPFKIFLKCDQLDCYDYANNVDLFAAGDVTTYH